MWQLSRQKLSRITEVQQFSFNRFFFNCIKIEKKQGPAESRTQTLAYKRNNFNPKPSGYELKNWEVSKKKQMEENLKRVKKLFTGKSRFPDFDTVAFASVIILNLVEQDVCPRNNAIYLHCVIKIG